MNKEQKKEDDGTDWERVKIVIIFSIICVFILLLIIKVIINKIN